MSLPSIPRGYEIINDTIDTRGSELMNTDVAAKVLLSKSVASETRTETVTDSQLLVFLPLQNKCSLQSIFIHTPEEIDGELQRPARAKVWSNLVTPLSFEEASSERAPSESNVSERDSNGWHEIPVKYVKFQNVSSILLLLDGEVDEDDVPIVLDRILFIGKIGSSLSAGSVKADAEED